MKQQIQLKKTVQNKGPEEHNTDYNPKISTKAPFAEA